MTTDYDWLDNPQLAKDALEVALLMTKRLRAKGYPPASVLVVAAGLIASVIKPDRLDEVDQVIDSLREIVHGFVQNRREAEMKRKAKDESHAR